MESRGRKIMEMALQQLDESEVINHHSNNIPVNNTWFDINNLPIVFLDDQVVNNEDMNEADAQAAFETLNDGDPKLCNLTESKITENSVMSLENNQDIENNYESSSYFESNDDAMNETENEDDGIRTKKKEIRKKQTRKVLDPIEDNGEINEPSSQCESNDNATCEQKNEDVGYGKRRKRMEAKNQIRKKNRCNGKSYVGHKGGVKREKKVQENPCSKGKGCGPRRCSEFTEEIRHSIFKEYWALDHQRQRDFLLNCIEAHSAKRKRTKVESSRTQLVRTYTLQLGENRVKVCRRFLMKTLDVSDKLLRYTETNKSDIFTSKSDSRGRHPPKNKTPEERRQDVMDFINSLPAVPSHYCRKSSTRKYLPAELKNKTNVYRMYADARGNQNIVDIQVFKNIFRNEFNIGFHVPKKDKCLICEVHNQTDKNLLTEANIARYESHILKKEVSKETFLRDQKESKNKESVLCTSFDLQKVLSTPNGDSFLLGFSSRYAVYNLTFYESGTRNVQCYVWGECDGKRGANDICTCVYKYLQSVDSQYTNVKEILLYCDSCTGQNKNHQMLAMLNWFVKNCKNISSVTLKFLLPGHTFMPVDSVHASIEIAHKKKIVYAPSEWDTIIRNAR